MNRKNNEINLVLFISGRRGQVVYSKLKEKNFNILKIVVGNLSDLYQPELFSELELAIVDKINDKLFINEIKNLNVDYFILSGFKQILKKELLSIPSKGTINLHGGKLPEYRGGSPLNWQIINGEDYAYISTILTDEGIDTGNILNEKKIKILDSDDIVSLHNKANKLFPDMTVESINMVENDKFGTKQSNKNAAYWHQRNDDDGYINFEKYNDEEILRLIKSLTHPYPCAWGVVMGKKVRISKAEKSQVNINGTPGKVLYLNNNGPYIVCRVGAIKLLNYNFENDQKRVLTKKDYFS